MPKPQSFPQEAQDPWRTVQGKKAFSYAGAAKKRTNTKTNPVQAQSANTAPKPAPKPAKSTLNFVVRFNGYPPHSASRKSTMQMTEELRRAFHDNAVCQQAGMSELLGCSWSAGGNITLVFPKTVNQKNVHDTWEDLIKPIVAEGLDADFSRDSAWAKVVLSNVPVARTAAGPQSAQTLQMEL